MYFSVLFFSSLAVLKAGWMLLPDQKSIQLTHLNPEDRIEEACISNAAHIYMA
jgi:hypothetical protein